jgi:hypothetical protein
MSQSSPLSTEEVIEFLAFSIGNINQQFELWLTITFAVIVASYVAGHKLSRVLRIWFVVLYSMVSSLLLLMLVSSGIAIQTYVAESQTQLGFESTQPLGLAIIILRMLVWIVGTGFTIFFILRGFRAANSDD